METPDNTTEPFVPFKKGGSFENSPVQIDELLELVKSSQSIQTKTGSYNFEDTSVLSTNTDSLEVEDCITGEFHELIIDTYDDTGSRPPRQAVKTAIQTFEVQLLEDDQKNSFQVSITPTVDAHLRKIMIKPKAAGTATIILRDTDENGCVLNSEREFEFEAGDIDTEFTIELENRIRLTQGNDIWVSYSGPNIAGHDFVSDPTWGTQFVPFVKTMSLPRTNKNLDVEELGEVKIVDLSLPGAVTIPEMRLRGWALADGTTSASQGIADAAILTAPDYRNKFFKVSDDQMSGTTGGVATNSLSWTQGDFDDNGQAGVEKIEGVSQGSITFDNEPPHYEVVAFVKVKMII